MIAKNSMLIVTTQFITRFIGWIGLIVLAKLWGGFAPEALGAIGFAMAFVELFTFIGDIGFSTAHVKRVSEGQDLGKCIGTFMAIKIVLSLIMVVIVTIVLLIGTFFGVTLYDTATESLIIIFIFYFMFSAFSQIPTTTFQATKEFAKRQLTVTTENIVKVPLFILVIVLGSGAVAYSLDEKCWIELLSLTYVAGMFASFLIGFYLLRKYPIKRPSFALFKSYFVFAIPITVLSLISTISVNIDKIMIGFYWTNMDVGYYFAVQQISQIVLIFSAAIGIVLFPTFSEYHFNNKNEDIKRISHLAMRYISMIMLPMIVILIVFAKPIISIMLTDAFMPAYGIFIVFALIAFISAIGTPFSSLIIGMNKPVLSAVIGFIICVSNIIMNFLFIPKNGLLEPFGINGALGAAIATLIAITIGFVCFCLISKRLTGVKILQKNLFVHIIAGLLMGLLLFVINDITVFMSIYKLVIAVAIGFTVYFGLLVAFGEFKTEDLEFFLEICNPKEILKHLRGENKK